ncbi:pyruvate dehydrogenase (acetyl-transferring) E1 component subunit alpha [Pseudoclavibacter chungangensis]|uniref:Pyruvate dehydrogenase (Acetyl-transferring) E1 component subunit alpha n=1 Tax=Pseudoclavibacter chungangensis TaxID=587635 RepID=A0A7J5BS36_9MICO|nr:pyruvate dehydrogenase (acetyl-transferring) E1 component subunit alpha [Pseudoclavibacter chungangensis]KAB1655625.1 pyruvate dehydrogenase (acetyl-transferring) E1 component subunit alpha [Pseudoclavibacter chungangensis]NYJ67974.1 pyruvate dehydrogenase E1 component alpha subunit [Pseudoclavibacter chungangensis]
MPHDDVRHDALDRPGDAPVQLIDEHGAAAPAERAEGFDRPDDATLLELYRKMVVARRFDVQVTALTRQGRLATYPSAQGQEASEIAAVLALRDEDWLFPTYRDTIALLTRGVPPNELLTFFRGEWHMGFDPHAYRISPQATPLATQTLHAAGLATAVKLRRDPVVALTLLGDGATSEGDTHEACNFAAVWHAPCVFVIQNNQYAISVPADKQFKARSLADRAIGYGMPGYWVDGNDAAAMSAVITGAVERARTGGGPSLIEAVTYRLEAHTNSDDPTRYRERTEEDEWRHRDPIARLGTFLRDAGALDDAREAEITTEAEALAATTREAMNAELDIDPLELFDHVYAHERPALRAQRDALAAELTEEANA